MNNHEIKINNEDESPEIIRVRHLPHETGLSRSTCWRLEKDPSSGFPKRIKLTPNGTAVGYLKTDLKKWRESRPTVVNEDGNPHKITTEKSPSSEILVQTPKSKERATNEE